MTVEFISKNMFGNYSRYYRTFKNSYQLNAFVDKCYANESYCKLITFNIISKQ